MIRLRRLPAFLLAAVAAGTLRAEWSTDLETEKNSGISAELECPFETLPPAGFLPLRLEIENFSGADRLWTAVSSISSGFSRLKLTMVSRRPIRVPAGSKSVFHILVPTLGTESGYQQSFLSLTGYGMTGEPASLPGINGNPSRTAYVAMSKKLAARSWNSLKDYLDQKKTPLFGSSFDPAAIGEDWRWFSGLGTLWITAAEYNGLNASQRLALRDWLLQGGELRVFSEDPALAPRAEFGASLAQDSISAGLGMVFFHSWNGHELSSEVAAGLLWKLGVGSSGMESQEYPSSWELARRIGSITWNLPLLIVGIVVFAIVVGPLNLFVFAGVGRRQRLFWTTPLISIVASVVLGILIFLQEGVGGAGARALFVYLDAGARRTVRLQEQVSRTGVLLQSAFRSPDIDRLVPIAVSGQTRLGKSFVEEGDEFSGDWFATRSRQSLFAQSLQSTRAEVRWIESVEGAPKVLSSLPVTLEEIFVIDATGKCWAGEQVSAGRQTALHPVDAAQLAGRLKKYPAGGLRLRKALESVRGRQSFFYAFTRAGEFLPTLPSIRWQDDDALYVGPLAVSATQ